MRLAVALLAFAVAVLATMRWVVARLRRESPQVQRTALLVGVAGYLVTIGAAVL
jgi:hypothetical protein